MKRHHTRATEIEEPLFDATELYGVVPSDARKPFDIREVMASIVDGSRFDEFQARFGTTLVTGFAKIYMACPFGIIARQRYFIFRVCTKRGSLHRALYAAQYSPTVPSKHHWLYGAVANTKMKALPKMAPKLVMAVATANVPKLTLVIGGSFGAGNYGMCGRAYSPRFMWTWPNSRISVMGGEQAASVLSNLKA